MPALMEDDWISEQAFEFPIAEIEDISIAIDATYYLNRLLDDPISHESLLPALGGLTNIKKHILEDLNQFEKHGVVPFFIFDGQPLKGQDEVSVAKGLRANEKTEQAWYLYHNGKAPESVATFSINVGAYRVEKLYPMLHDILIERNHHFLVAPHNASAQIAYLDMVESEQVGAIMGSHELLLYPVVSDVIKSINWEKGTLSAIRKSSVMGALKHSEEVEESLFIDAFLAAGTSFLPTFPGLLDPNMSRGVRPSIRDSLNLLRVNENSVTLACTAFGDVLQRDDKDWLDKFQQARMIVNHFIYIAESGAVKVHNFDNLTKDNFKYLGLSLPQELFDYLNKGLVGPRLLSWITHLQITVLPTIDGVASEEYRKLVTTQVQPIKEQALGIVCSKLSRGISHRQATLRVWYDLNFQHNINLAELSATPQAQGWAGWDIKENTLKQSVPGYSSGSIASELVALTKAEVVKTTVARGKVKHLTSHEAIASLVVWRFLHLRGYVNDSHTLTNWGSALSTAMTAFASTVQKYPEVPHLYEFLLVAFELIRFDLLNSKNKHEELHGLAINNMNPDDQDSLLLISRCATLLKLRHEGNGYTGPLSKNLLNFRSLISEVRSADRDLTEALMANLFTSAVGRRIQKTADAVALSHRLPFLADPDVALGIAVKTWLDDVKLDTSKDEKAQRLAEFQGIYVPYATHFQEDLDIAFHFFDAIHAGVKTLSPKEMPPADATVWDKAAEYLGLRR